MEWVDYHLKALKFDRVVVYDNSPDFNLERWRTQLARPGGAYPNVDVVHWPGTQWKGKQRQRVAA